MNLTKLKQSCWNALVEARQNEVKLADAACESDSIKVMNDWKKSKINLGNAEIAWFEICNLG